MATWLRTSTTRVVIFHILIHQCLLIWTLANRILFPELWCSRKKITTHGRDQTPQDGHEDKVVHDHVRIWIFRHWLIESGKGKSLKFNGIEYMWTDIEKSIVCMHIWINSMKRKYIFMSLILKFLLSKWLVSFDSYVTNVSQFRKVSFTCVYSVKRGRAERSFGPLTLQLILLK